MVSSLTSYSRLLSRIWPGSIGRKLRKSEAPAALNMFPKFEEVPISTFLIVLAKMRRPSTTPSARTPRSFSSRTTSAASLATSVAVSTEMPTSASWRAIASLTPSPRKPTSAPSVRCARMMRDFCSGVTRAKIVVCGRAAASSASLIASSSLPASVPSDCIPRSEQTVSATRPLSPVTSLTVTPSFASRSSDGAASAFGDLGAAREDRLRRTLGDQEAAGRAVGERRPELPLVVERRFRHAPPAVGAGASIRCFPERAVEVVAADDRSVLQRGLVRDQPERQHPQLGPAGGVERLLERDPSLGEGAGLVREQHLDVAEILDRDQPLDDHRPLREPARSRRQADGDDRRQQLRRQPDGDRKREEHRLEQ